MRFVTLFTRTENLHLQKDVGLLPYYLHKEFGVDASIATYENGEYPSLEQDTPGLKLEFVKRRFGRSLDGAAYLKREAKNIDVLNIYHLNLSSFFYSIYYRLKNKNGKIYLKLDMDHFDLYALKSPGPVRLIKNLTVRAAHLISCESTFMKRELENLGVFSKKNILYIPDGLYRRYQPPFEEKKKIFLTVGRLGSEQKDTETLLDAFAASADKHDWSLRLAGGMDEQFRELVVKEFFEDHPELSERVVFTGMITDKEQLHKEYAQAGVFVLPSRWESFGIVLAEAAACGCRIITTDVVPSADDITDHGKYGCTVPVADVPALAAALAEAAENPQSDEISREEAEYAQRIFNWEDIIKRLYDELVK